MNQRLERVSGEIKEVLSELLVRGAIKDPRVQAAGIITITHVRVTGDLQQATALFMVHGADMPTLLTVRKGLGSAAGYLRREIGKRLRLRVTPTLMFEIDKTFEQEEKVDALLREISRDEPTKGE